MTSALDELRLSREREALRRQRLLFELDLLDSPEPVPVVVRNWLDSFEDRMTYSWSSN